MKTHPSVRRFHMSQGIKTVIYPVTDLARAKATFQNFLGVEPSADQPYYVGFRVGDLDRGLDPNGHKAGMTAYYDVDDIKQTLQSLLDAGAQIEQEIKAIGGGGLIGSVRDADGNIIGLRQGS
jgi:predicted enzyme related to lactoylglutathione lyase